MIIKPIKTRKFLPPQDNLWDLLSALPKLKESNVVAVASKVVSIGEGRCLPAGSAKDKDELIKQEADEYLPREAVPGGWAMHTLKNGIFMPSAGIDESNSAGYYILWPKNSMDSARRIWKFLKTKHRLKKIGVIITDSRSIPLRRGITGIALAFFGFEPLRDYRGSKDIFGRRLVFSQTNIADSLSAGAVLAMGEGGEQTPLAVIENVPFVKFTNRKPGSRKKFSSFLVKLEEDLYAPFLNGVKWKKGGGGRK